MPGQRVRALERGERGTTKEKMTDAENGGLEAEDLTIAESTTPMTIAKPVPTARGTATAVGIGIEPENGTEDPVPNV